jgi:hypothetical protein
MALNQDPPIGNSRFFAAIEDMTLETAVNRFVLSTTSCSRKGFGGKRVAHPLGEALYDP